MLRLHADPLAYRFNSFCGSRDELASERLRCPFMKGQSAEHVRRGRYAQEQASLPRGLESEFLAKLIGRSLYCKGREKAGYMGEQRSFCEMSSGALSAHQIRKKFQPEWDVTASTYRLPNPNA